ncbi:sporulation protein [Nocardia sp. 2]|uniref:Sporulation protein n=1 Tax=Nocardia acididurans TaxID=2802282 RepID=A0ABS1MDM6_9NOCA|nr:sporulation protein [Nocardia acididurans]MBL1078722.1 sporulation protein [Nocardia acididurans]
MVEKLPTAGGVGGARVETELHTPVVRPGELVRGVIRLRGGDIRRDVNRIAVELVATIADGFAGEHAVEPRRFHRSVVAGPLHWEAHGGHDFEFELALPFEAPLTGYDGNSLPGTAVSVRTLVDLTDGIAGDTRPLTVEPLGVQHEILYALEDLGFGLQHAELEDGWIRGIQQELAFYQEIRFAPSTDYPKLEELVVVFVAGTDGVEVVLEVNRNEGDAYGSLYVDYGEEDDLDWTATLDAQLSGLGH